MSDDYRIDHVDKPGPAEWAVIGQGITEYNRQQGGDENPRQVCFVLRGPDGAIVGGVIGAVYWDWLYIDLIWIREDVRGQGYGHRLLTLAEEEGRRRGARQAHLDTFSFQAPGFYERHGYSAFGVLEDFPQGHQRYFLTKRL